MIHEIVQIQEIDILFIDPAVLDHLHFSSDHLKILVLDIVIVIENSIPIELQHVQDTLTSITEEETLDFLQCFFQKNIALVLFQDPTLETDSTLESIFFHFELHQDHVLDLGLHLEGSSIIFNQVPLKIMTTTLKHFQGQITNLN